jgi:hypothetical protein
MPDEYRHPSGVLIKFGSEVDDEGRRHYRSLVHMQELNVEMARRVGNGAYAIPVQIVRVNTAAGWIEVCGFDDDDYIEPMAEVTRVALADVVSLEVW